MMSLFQYNFYVTQNDPQKAVYLFKKNTQNSSNAEE